MQQLNIKVEVFKEDDLYVALCPSLNVSSFGETIEEAKKSLIGFDCKNSFLQSQGSGVRGQPPAHRGLRPGGESVKTKS